MVVKFALNHCLNEELVSSSDDLIYVQNFQELSAKFTELDSSFSLHTNHAVAIKTNPLLKVLQKVEKEGKWVEAASLQEVKLAIKAGFTPDRIVFDSPVKTQNEINWCVKNLSGAVLNVNSLDELERYPLKVPFRLGLRLTVQASTTSHQSMNVSGAWSKFGIPIGNYNEILNAVKNTEAITDLHLHQGSQFDNLSNQVNGIRSVVDLALKINNHLQQKIIQRINIGGGFPVNYQGEPFKIQEYTDRIKKVCPELWDGTFNVITEFGRFTHAHAGTMFSKVEYVKQTDNGQILLTHSGADVLLRECYQQNEWPHKLSLFNADGKEKDAGSTVLSQVAGPLCFGGDYPFRNVQLPKAKPGDWIMIHDVGANSLALWSKHCSRPFPKIIGFENKEFTVLKEKQPDEDVISFWA